MRIRTVFSAVSGLILIIALIFLGANEDVLQFVGNVGETVPVVGSWINALSAFSWDTITAPFSETVSVIFGTLLNCLAANIMDTIFLAVLAQITENFIYWHNGRTWTDTLAFGNTVLVSLIGVGVLYVLKLNGATTKAILVGVADIALVLVGIFVMCGGFHTRQAWFFLMEVLANAIETAAGVGIICISLMALTMFRNKTPLGAWIMLFVFLAAFCIIIHYLKIAEEQVKKA